MNYKQQLGHLFNDKMHVCGYKNDKILVQSEAGKPMRQYSIYEDSIGTFFNYKGDRKYVHKN